MALTSSTPSASVEEASVEEDPGEFRVERSHLENQERAYIAASRRTDRCIEARMESAKRASAIHKERTGRALRIRMQDVLNEEMYEEEEDDSYLPLRYYELNRQLAQVNLQFTLQLSQYVSQVEANDADKKAQEKKAVAQKAVARAQGAMLGPSACLLTPSYMPYHNPLGQHMVPHVGQPSAAYGLDYTIPQAEENYFPDFTPCSYVPSMHDPPMHGNAVHANASLRSVNALTGCHSLSDPNLGMFRTPSGSSLGYNAGLIGSTLNALGTALSNPPQQRPQKRQRESLSPAQFGTTLSNPAQQRPQKRLKREREPLPPDKGQATIAANPLSLQTDMLTGTKPAEPILAASPLRTSKTLSPTEPSQPSTQDSLKAMPNSDTTPPSKDNLGAIPNSETPPSKDNLGAMPNSATPPSRDNLGSIVEEWLSMYTNQSDGDWEMNLGEGHEQRLDDEFEKTDRRQRERKPEDKREQVLDEKKQMPEDDHEHAPDELEQKLDCEQQKTLA